MQHKMTGIILLSILMFTLILPTNISAKNIDKVKENKITLETGTIVHSFAKKKEMTACADDDSLLGDVSNEDSVAWLVQKLLNYIRILGPSLAIVLGSIDYIKAIISSDENEMKKTNSKFVKRMIAAVLLFFIPTITTVLLDLFGITTDCGIS